MALVTWALLWAFQDRWTGAGWLFGVGLAVQPLVIVVFPLLLVLGGRHRTLGLLVRGAVPAVAVIVGPLVADAHDTLHAVVDQPTFPNLAVNFRTLWAPLAPHLGGPRIDRDGRWRSAPPGRPGLGRRNRLVVALRWRQRPEMIVWAAALALALRVYTESVMTAYYTWPALALGVVIAGAGRHLAVLDGGVGRAGRPPWSASGRSTPTSGGPLQVVGRDRRPRRRRPPRRPGTGAHRAGTPTLVGRAGPARRARRVPGRRVARPRAGRSPGAESGPTAGTQFAARRQAGPDRPQTPE